MQVDPQVPGQQVQVHAGQCARASVAYGGDDAASLLARANHMARDLHGRRFNNAVDVRLGVARVDVLDSLLGKGGHVVHPDPKQWDTFQLVLYVQEVVTLQKK